jgi:hypothetical protein
MIDMTEFEGKNMTIEQVSKEIARREKRKVSVKWAVGFRDRGHGHGDYAVITASKGELVVECDFLGMAKHIVDAHNATLKKRKGNHG